MSNRKAWTKQEDEALQQLYEVRRVRKWVQIAKIMEGEFGLKGKNGKQCRQRYHNHLDQSIKHQKWCQQQQKELITLQNELGNKWAQISRVIQGRSENDIKNQFFSILRRGLRVINILIRKNLKRNNELEISLIYKIAEVCQKINNKKTINKEYLKNISLKRTITKYALVDAQAINNKEKLQEIKQFIAKLKTFDVSGKKTSKSQEVLDSQQIQSAQLRDNYPFSRRLSSKKSKESLKVKPQKNENVAIISESVEENANQDCINAENYPYLKNLRRQSSRLSNHSFEINAHRYFQMTQQEPLFKFNESGEYQYINTTPTPRPIITPSPYFDQAKSNFTNWKSFYPQ